MAWKNQGDDPWGGRQSSDLKKLLEKIRKSTPFGSFSLGKYGLVPYLAGIFVVLWLLSGVYFVKPDEVGQVKRFGKAVRITAPGPHYHLPRPIETVLTPSVTSVRRIEIGFRPTGQSIPGESLMLTRAENIVDLTFIVQYRIKDPGDYLFNVTQQDKTVKDAAEAAMRQVVGDNDIDDILTIGKFRIQQDAMTILQDILDMYRSGILIVAVELQDVHPPVMVMEAFRDVASAREDRARMINQAHGYRNELLPRAKGMASEIVNEAIGYKEARIIRARGEASRFTQILAQYASAPEVTRERLYIETMEEILPSMEKIILEGAVGANLLPHLSLESGFPGSPAPEGEVP
ncbi:MAG: FtsH protease activity modulator HflK [Syntrophales bacterium]|jgi:membrane protease subunit HflK|nr:FtsH protease activity modulator HflK [Syntrophales bacterium]MCK9527267.1 FtsH protease activity modulator HflK [Syntrophales bacterium]MDX9921263.1 FtsH protease activity modulator HflK [Syntrophales bacterium]